MKLPKTIKAELSHLYNNHLASCYMSKARLIDQALRLSAEYPDEFSCELRGNYPTRYKFTIKRLGYLPDFIKSINETF
jgi:hypothetical protein